MLVVQVTWFFQAFIMNVPTGPISFNWERGFVLYRNDVLIIFNKRTKGKVQSMNDSKHIQVFEKSYIVCIILLKRLE
jgi:hypothetical protein